LDAFVVEQVFATATELDLTRHQDIAAVGDFQGCIGILLDQQHGRALLIDFTDDRENVAHDQRCQTKRRFVHHQDLWLGHQSPADCKHLLFAAREGACHLPVPFLEAREQIIHALDILGDTCFVLAQIGADLEIFQDRQIGKDFPAFGDQNDAALDNFLGVEAADDLSIVADGAAGSIDQATDAFQGRGLAGPIGADQSDDFASLDLEGNAFQRFDPAIVDTQVFNFEQAHSSTPR